MERLDFDQTRIDELRASLQADYGEYPDPCPGSNLKRDDDIMWNGFAPARVLWGYDDPAFFFGYCPTYFGDRPVPLAIQYVTDRAPADPTEQPMPVIVEQP